MLCADKFGTGLSFIKADVGGNVDRLAKAYESNAEENAVLFNIVVDEVRRGQHEGKSSDTKGLLWLKRCGPCPFRKSRWSAAQVTGCFIGGHCSWRARLVWHELEMSQVVQVGNLA